MPSGHSDTHLKFSQSTLLFEKNEWHDQQRSAPYSQVLHLTAQILHWLVAISRYIPVEHEPVSFATQVPVFKSRIGTEPAVSQLRQKLESFEHVLQVLAQLLSELTQNPSVAVVSLLHVV